MTEVRDGYLYTESDEWVMLDEEKKIATVGITDYAQSKLTDITFVELPEVGAEVKKGDPVAVVESVKSAADIYSPLSGNIVEVNSELEDSPEKINEDPYGAWIYKIEISDPGELDSLMDAEKYREYRS